MSNNYTQLEIDWFLTPTDRGAPTYSGYLLYDPNTIPLKAGYHTARCSFNDYRDNSTFPLRPKQAYINNSFNTHSLYVLFSATGIYYNIPRGASKTLKLPHDIQEFWILQASVAANDSAEMFFHLHDKHDFDAVETYNTV